MTRPRSAQFVEEDLASTATGEVVDPRTACRATGWKGSAATPRTVDATIHHNFDSLSAFANTGSRGQIVSGWARAVKSLRPLKPRGDTHTNPEPLASARHTGPGNPNDRSGVPGGVRKSRHGDLTIPRDRAQRPFLRVPARFRVTYGPHESPRIDDLGFPRGRGRAERDRGQKRRDRRPRRRGVARDAPVSTVPGGAQRSVFRWHRRAGLRPLLGGQASLPSVIHRGWRGTPPLRTLEAPRSKWIARAGASPPVPPWRPIPIG